LKKIIALLTAAVLCLSTFGVVFAEEGGSFDEITNEKINILFNYGIFQGDETGDLQLEDNLTRAEFCKIMCILLGHEANTAAPQKFDDVDASHWAYGYVNTISSLGIINGDENGLFLPENNISIQDALKILVVALGYGEQAEALTGYPVGHIIVAGQLSIIKNTSLVATKDLKRSEAISLIYNTLDVPVCENGVVLNGKDGNALVTLRGNF